TRSTWAQLRILKHAYCLTTILQPKATRCAIGPGRVYTPKTCVPSMKPSFAKDSSNPEKVERLSGALSNYAKTVRALDSYPPEADGVSSLARATKVSIFCY